MLPTALDGSPIKVIDANTHYSEPPDLWTSRVPASYRGVSQGNLVLVPLRRPRENADDEPWRLRGSFADVDHPEIGRAVTYASSKWIADDPWTLDRPAPRLDQHGQDDFQTCERGESGRAATVAPVRHPRRGTPMALGGVRIFDFTWFLASAGGTRFLRPSPPQPGAAGRGAYNVVVVVLAEHPQVRIFGKVIDGSAPEIGQAVTGTWTAPLDEHGVRLLQWLAWKPPTERSHDG